MPLPELLVVSRPVRHGPQRPGVQPVVPFPADPFLGDQARRTQDPQVRETAGRLIWNGAARSCTDRAPPVSSSSRARRTGLAMASNTSGRAWPA